MSLKGIFTRILRHGDLFEGMVCKLGLDDRMAGLPHAAEVHRRAANRCLSCSEGDACEEWLKGSGTPDEAPGYCRNHDMLMRLKKLEDATA
ncbi:hypothetical protein CSC94_05355 [Zhengella mangrovi]|uniref:DUF6455 domain-containing protein n=1 Tax=Zhengella mangrovi TaxID=1982044 RepID=A0A2G1QRH8_9HYPH|nr:DUF6455 family protein [Zhengella mangrovi]PHP68089.1 hypothetical protein CSC94_05355 [Zhengella mangrovi]